MSTTLRPTGTLSSEKAPDYEIATSIRDPGHIPGDPMGYLPTFADSPQYNTRRHNQYRRRLPCNAQVNTNTAVTERDGSPSQSIQQRSSPGSDASNPPCQRRHHQWSRRSLRWAADKSSSCRRVRLVNLANSSPLQLNERIDMSIARMNEAACVAALQKAVENGNAKMVGSRYFPCSEYARDICARLTMLGKGSVVASADSNRITMTKPAPVPQVHRRPGGSRNSWED